MTLAYLLGYIMLGGWFCTGFRPKVAFVVASTAILCLSPQRGDGLGGSDRLLFLSIDSC